MNKSALLLAVASLQFGATAYSAPTDTTSDKTRLEMALSCHGSAQPHELIGWISNFGGAAIVDSARTLIGTEYTLPNPVYVLGFPTTRLNIRAFHGQDRTFTVYETIFPDKPFRSIASIVDLAPDEAGNYQQRVGKNHLFLREQAGVTYVTCAIGVHSAGIKRALHAQADDETSITNTGDQHAGYR